MNRRQVVAQSLVGLGSLILLLGAGLHLFAGYPLLAAALESSNLNLAFANAARAVFLLMGFAWITIAVVTLIAAFTQTRIRRILVLVCGLAVLAEIPIWVRLMGWFIGNEMVLLSGILITFGGLLLPPSTKP